MDPRGQDPGVGRLRQPRAAVQAGRDVALLDAMLNVIVAEGIVDIQYVQAHTEASRA